MSNELRLLRSHHKNVNEEHLETSNEFRLFVLQDNSVKRGQLVRSSELSLFPLHDKNVNEEHFEMFNWLILLARQSKDVNVSKEEKSNSPEMLQLNHVISVSFPSLDHV